MANLSDNFKKFLENIELTEYQVEDGDKKATNVCKTLHKHIMMKIILVQQNYLLVHLEKILPSSPHQMLMLFLNYLHQKRNVTIIVLEMDNPNYCRM